MSESFLGIGSLVCFKLSMMLKAHLVLCVKEPDFLFCPQNGENGPKIDFLSLLENFSLIFYEFGQLRKFVICYTLAQFPYLGKI